LSSHSYASSLPREPLPLAAELVVVVVVVVNGAADQLLPGENSRHLIRRSANENPDAAVDRVVSLASPVFFAVVVADAAPPPLVGLVVLRLLLFLSRVRSPILVLVLELVPTVVLVLVVVRVPFAFGLPCAFM
jgi:hypothetical protein